VSKQIVRQNRNTYSMHDDPQKSSKGVRAARWLYYASMTAGFPLWLLTAFIFVAWVRFTVSPLPSVGPVEFDPPPNTQIAVMITAVVAFLFVYPAAFFWAHRITRRPWIVFAAMLIPVAVFCYSVAFFPITDSNSEENAWLSYLGTMALVLVSGAIVSAASDRHHPSTRQTSPT
jgi:hypothetical protein